ncbi:acid protease [Xylariaceae sp. FL0662B]|nr:acid protease [Xylariaceae sp. FL0662B]
MSYTRLVLAYVCSWILECWASGDNAVVISPSEYFEGNDGPWSSFFLRVGTPEQDVRALVSTASPESMVVLSDYGCSTSVFETVPANCAVSRGNLFIPNKSLSWDELGIFGINENGVGLEANLGYSQRSEVGLETLGIGLTGPKLDNQTVAGIATPEPFYLGIFGLNNQPVNFSSLGNYSSPSFLTTLKDQQIIPSLSWSYTAGAKYRLKQVYGQLIFSGYDASRFTENSVSFTMADDVTRDLVVVLQSISYSGSTSAILLSDPINIFMDSTDPNLWLPDSVCDAFEDAFGLTVDNTTGLYLVNDTHHTTLLNSGAEVTFRLSDVTNGGDAVTIVLPYSAFDLTAEYPLVNNTGYYFPLKRAANSTQYTLGRTFLQEAYLTADYERETFNVSACAWVEGAEENIVTIPSRDSNSGSSSTTGGSSLSGGAIAGIVVGAVIAALIVGAAIALIVRRRRKRAAYAVSEPQPDMSVITGPVHNAPPTPAAKYYSPETVGNSTNESDSKRNGGSVADQNGHDSNSPDTHNTGPDTELDGNSQQIFQLHGDSRPQPHNEAPIYYELGGSEVGRAASDRVSTAGTSSSPDKREKGDEPPSPFVSTLGTLGWQGDRGDASSDLVSPTTPVHSGSRAP